MRSISNQVEGPPACTRPRNTGGSHSAVCRGPAASSVCRSQRLTRSGSSSRSPKRRRRRGIASSRSGLQVLQARTKKLHIVQLCS